MSMEYAEGARGTRATHYKNLYDGLQNDVLSMAASDAALELAQPPPSSASGPEYSSEKLADLLSACSNALRKERHGTVATPWGRLLRKLGVEQV